MRKDKKKTHFTPSPKYLKNLVVAGIQLSTVCSLTPPPTPCVPFAPLAFVGPGLVVLLAYELESESESTPE